MLGAMRRGVATLQRQPQNPEDDTVLDGDGPSVSLTERAIQVRAGFLVR